MLCFASPRTDHIVKTRAESQGFVVKDTIMWVYGTGQIHTYKFGREIQAELNKHNQSDPALVKKHMNDSIKLRPAYEPCIVLQKPYFKNHTHAQSVINGGCGAMDIFNTRFDNGDKLRYPSNFIHDNSAPVLEQFELTRNTSVANYFYYPKPSVAEKNDGCVNLPKKTKQFTGSLAKNKNTAPQGNFHDCVKPVKLLQHLTEIYCPKRDTVLDMYAGSGSTGVASLKSGYSFIGIELDNEYCQIAVARLSKTLDDLGMTGELDYRPLNTSEEAA